MAESSITFTGIHFWVADLVRSLAFYRALGIPVPDSVEGEFFNLQLPNGQSLAFGTHGLTRRYDPSFESPPDGKSALALQFNLPSRQAVGDLYEKLVAAGYEGHLAPIDAYWGARYAEVTDPDGNVVGFHSPRA